VNFDVQLSNKGTVRVIAKRKRDQGRAYKEDVDILKYSVDLLVRRITAPTTSGAHVQWWSDSQSKSPQAGDLEADLLDEYEVNGETDFWIEPRETQHGSATIVLEAGLYLAMVTFVGASSDEEFWRRVFLVGIP
jgi:hypothetical protein